MATRGRFAAAVQRRPQFHEGLPLSVMTVETSKDSVGSATGAWAQVRCNDGTWATGGTRIDKSGLFALDRKFVEPISLSGI